MKTGVAAVPAMYCIVDGKPIPESRVANRAVTCSAECARKASAIRREMVDQRRCRHCHRPSTPEERKQFAQWRREQGKLKSVGRPKADPAGVLQ